MPEVFFALEQHDHTRGYVPCGRGGKDGVIWHGSVQGDVSTDDKMLSHLRLKRGADGGGVGLRQAHGQDAQGDAENPGHAVSLLNFAAEGHW
jgi:hypothetical protein